MVNYFETVTAFDENWNLAKDADGKAVCFTSMQSPFKGDCEKALTAEVAAAQKKGVAFVVATTGNDAKNNTPKAFLWTRTDKGGYKKKTLTAAEQGEINKKIGEAEKNND